MDTSTRTVSQEEELAAARQVLRRRQEEDGVKNGLKRRPDVPPVRELALDRLNQQTHFESTADPNTVSRGIFKFDRSQELKRVRLAEEIIGRVDPGPYEDPSYLAMLAFQAASIEMAFESLSGAEEAERWSQFLLGTVHSSEVNAFALTFSHDRHVIVVMYSALVDFVYQAAKALTAAQNPARSERSDATVSTRPDVKSIERMLETNPEPIERLYKTLEAYFYKGYPRAFANEVVPELHHPSLGVLIGLAERWALAHEYGHGFARDLHWSLPPGANPDWAEEFFADQNATILSVVSTGLLDSMPPELSLASGIFVLGCLDVLRRAASIVREGTESPVTDDATHPPNKVRAQRVVQTFYHFFDAIYDGPHLRDLTFVRNRPTPPVVSDSVREQIKGAFDYANGLFAIWKPVAEMLKKDYANNRPLHHMWLSE